MRCCPIYPYNDFLLYPATVSLMYLYIQSYNSFLMRTQSTAQWLCVCVLLKRVIVRTSRFHITFIDI